jgi:hypothetical protein
MRSPEPLYETSPSLSPKWIKRIAVAIPLGCICLCAILYFWITLPRYIEFEMPHIESLTDTGRIERSTLTRDGELGMSFLLRREFYCRRSQCGTRAIIIGQFDDALCRQGWSRVDDEYGNPCQDVLPETQKLKVGIRGYVVYQPLDNQGYRGDSICIAMTEETSGYVSILVGTVNDEFFDWGPYYVETGSCTISKPTVTPTSP